MKLNIDGNSVTVEFSYSPASDIVMVIEDGDGNKDVITIPAGSSSPYNVNFETVKPQKISNVLIGSSEENATSTEFSDSKYEYSISINYLNTDDIGYGYLKHAVVEGGLTEEVVKSSFNMADNNMSIKYAISPVAIDGFNTLSEEDFRDVLKDEQLDLLIYTTKKIEKVLANGSDDQTSAWELNYDTITVDGVEYQVSRYIDDEMVNIYDPSDQMPEIMYISYGVEF